MKKTIEELTDHVIVCGLGRIGRVLRTDLEAAGATVVFVDNNAERVSAAVEHGSYALTGDATSDEVLLEAGVTRARALAAGCGSASRSATVRRPLPIRCSSARRFPRLCAL